MPYITPLGGVAIRLINKTGANSVQGTLVQADTTVDMAFDICDADGIECIGVVYDNGVPDGSKCLVIIYGFARVLLKDTTASTAGNWVQVSDVAGRADATNGSPAAAPTHFLEIGHCFETKTGGTNVLTICCLHFL